MVSSSNTKATPKKPIPTRGNLTANTALPHPPNTSQKVPKNFANSFLSILNLLENQMKYSSRKYFS
jgi:hypothetical protein